MRKLLIVLLLGSIKTSAQELYVFSEPASNMPSRSLAVKQSGKWLRNRISKNTESRYSTELMLGASSKLMLHSGVTFSDMYTPAMRFESARLYGKYRVYSQDEMYRHFRLAVFAEAVYGRNREMYEEISLDGDQGGVQLGLIATQLLHKLAVSSSVSFTEVLQASRWEKGSSGHIPYEALNYSLSAGYLVFPKNYTSYKQTNMNIYLELLGQKTVDKSRYFVDLAPAVQFIFNSAVKLNIGYRFELGSDMHRMAGGSWMAAVEWQFLDVLGK